MEKKGEDKEKIVLKDLSVGELERMLSLGTKTMDLNSDNEIIGDKPEVQHPNVMEEEHIEKPETSKTEELVNSESERFENADKTKVLEGNDQSDEEVESKPPEEAERTEEIPYSANTIDSDAHVSDSPEI
jgi:hypothetical protein